VLASATIGGAKVLGLERELGTIEPGKLADLVLLDADPLADIDNVSHTWRVVRAGRVLDPAALMADVARTAHPIQPRLP
jgi:imidazolonepropionase-like amidohydrolase